MLSYLFGLSLPMDREWLVDKKQRKLRFAQSSFRNENRPTVEDFTRLLLEEADPNTASIPEDSFSKSSIDPLYIPRLCASGLIVIEDSKPVLAWRNEAASFTLAKYLVSTIEDGSISIRDAVSNAEKLDLIFQTRLFQPLKWAFEGSKRKSEIVEYLKEQVRNLFQTQLYTGHVINGSASNPEFPWSQQLRYTEREHPFRSNNDQRHFLFCVNLLHYLDSGFAKDLIELAQTPIQFLLLQRRIDVTDPAYFQGAIRSQANSFLVFAIQSHVVEQYGMWTHEANAWRSLPREKWNTLPTAVELLHKKSKLDESTVSLARQFIDSIPSPLTAHGVHAALSLVGELLGSMRIRWQTLRHDTDGLRAPLLDALARQLSIRAKAESGTISSGLSTYLSCARAIIDDRFAIVSELGMSESCGDSLKSLLRDTLLQKTASFLVNPFAEYPHFPQKNRFERNFTSFRQFLFQDEASRRIFFSLLRDAVSAQLVLPESDSHQDFNRIENCAYFSRIALLGDLSLLPATERDEYIGILKQCYLDRLEAAPPFGAAQGLRNEFVKRGIISQTEIKKIDLLPNEEVRQMPPDRRKYYSRHLIEEGEYAEAKRILEDLEQKSWTKGQNNGGQTSEDIFNWMLSLYLNADTTPEDYAEAVRIFEINRECVGVDPESAYTLASVMAERSNLFPKAIQFIDGAIRSNPGNLDHWLNKLVILLKARDGIGAYRLSEEIPCAYRALDRVAHLRLAAQVSAIENLPKQIGDLADHLIERNPGDHDARYNKAIAQVHAGQFGQAIAICREILLELPGDLQTGKLLSNLESKTRSQNLDLLKSGITVKLPVRIGGEFREFPLTRIVVGHEAKTTTRIAVAQIGIPEFPKKAVEKTIFDAPGIALKTIAKTLADAAKQDAKMVFFPELTIPHELQAGVQELAKKHSMWIIGGARYVVSGERRFNRSVLVTPEGNWHYGEPKIEPAPAEAQRFSDFVRGDAIAVFQGTPVGRIGILICFDCYEPGLMHCLRDEVDLIFVPSANPDSERLEHFACSQSSSYGVPIVVANATGFGLSCYAAYCFKSEMIEKTGCEKFSITDSEKTDRLICVTVPDDDIRSTYLATRPSHRPSVPTSDSENTD